MVELNFKSGDKIRLRLAHKEIDGIYIENPDNSLILLKLDSGYNIGISKENILGSRILENYIEKEKGTFFTQSEKGKPTIGLVVTGGTIASKVDSRTGGVKPLTDIAEFANFYPEIFEMANVKKILSPFMIASESMTPSHWISISNSVYELLQDKEIQGVVVTHGTELLGYTGAALSFFLRDLGKPAVLTYSQRSIDRASSDASLNLQCAIKIALSDASGVFLVGHATTNDDFCYALNGTKARKMHSSRRDSFKSINDSPIAKIWPDKIEFLEKYNKRNNEAGQLDNAYSDKTALVKFYPGQDSSILDFYALKYKGIIVEASGLGHLPVGEGENNWIPTLKKHIRNGFVVCVTTQTINGRVDPYVYSNGRALLDAGVIFLEDMLAETALVKLGWVLGHYGWKTHIKNKMLENFAGELSGRLVE